MGSRIMSLGRVLATAGLVLLAGGCGTTAGTPRPGPLAGLDAADAPGFRSELEVQALVMGMADDYGAALGEAVYLVVRDESATPRGRWLAQSFLRNGMGAAIDIGASSNPSVALLDLLVLGSLQRWAFEAHWVPAGIGPAGLQAVQRLAEAEQELWREGARALEPEQLATLRGLVDAWIAAHPDRTVVSLVRFDEFTHQRRLPAHVHASASGLLASLEEAKVAVEDATLLGERVLWFAGRLPYVLGQQAELTAYRMADQPEAALARDGLAALEELTATVSARFRTLDADLADQQQRFFASIAEERATALDALAERVRNEREEAVASVFDRVAAERTALFDEIEERQEEVLPVMTELGTVIRESDELTRDLTAAIEVLDRVVSRFDRDPGEVHEPLDLQDVAESAREAGAAAEKLTVLLERTDALLASPDWDRPAEHLDVLTGGLVDRAEGLVDRAFWRALVLVLVLLSGLALLRTLPRRT